MALDGRRARLCESKSNELTDWSSSQASRFFVYRSNFHSCLSLFEIKVWGFGFFFPSATGQWGDAARRGPTEFLTVGQRHMWDLEAKFYLENQNWACAGAQPVCASLTSLHLLLSVIYPSTHSFINSAVHSSLRPPIQTSVLPLRPLTHFAFKCLWECVRVRRRGSAKHTRPTGILKKRVLWRCLSGNVFAEQTENLEPDAFLRILTF